MKWFKMWVDARNDAKLNSLSDDEFRIWHKLLCYAAEQPDPGTIKNYDQELLFIEVTHCNGHVTACNFDSLKTTLERLVKLQIITHENNTIIFINFKKRNEKPKNATPEEVKKRVAKHRESKKFKNVTDCNLGVTDLKRGVTGCNAPEQKKKREEEKKSTTPTPSFEKDTSPPERSEVKNPADELVLKFHEKFPEHRRQFSLSGAAKCNDEFTQMLKDGFTFDEILLRMEWVRDDPCPAPWVLRTVKKPAYGPGTEFPDEKSYSDNLIKTCHGGNYRK